MKKAIILFIISVVILISLLIYKSYTKSPIEPTQPAKKYIPVERLETVNYKKTKTKEKLNEPKFLGPALDEQGLKDVEKIKKWNDENRRCWNKYAKDGKTTAAYSACFDSIRYLLPFDM